MPLARIITRTPKDAIAASEYLLSQGYTVETASPEEFHIIPAEIELNLDRCRPDEAVDRAKKLVESQRMAVQAQTEAAAAPEPAHPHTAKIAVAYDITGRPVEFADQEETERRQKPNRMGKALAFMLAALAGAWQSVKSPVRGLQRRRAEQRALKLEAELAREREEIRREQELAREPVRQQPPQRSSERTRPSPMRRRSAPLAIPRKAVAIALGASLALLLGFAAYANRRPASPLAPGALMKNELVRQDVPFGAATITPTPAAVVPKPSASVPAKASPAVRPATRKPSAGRRSAQLLRRPSHDDSPAADEVVVRRSPAPRPKPQPSAAKLRQQSDKD